MAQDPINMFILRECKQGRLGIQWLQSLARASVRSQDGGLGERAYGLARELDAVDEEIADTFVLDIMFFPLPKGWWWKMPLLYAGGFLWAAQEDHYEDRLISWAWALTILGFFASMVILYKLVRERRLQFEKGRRRPGLNQRRKELENELCLVRDALLEQASEEAGPP